MAEPDATGAPILYRRAMVLLAKLEAEADLIGRIIVSGSLEHGKLRLRLNPSVVAAELATAPETFAAELLSLSQSFTLRRRGIETKIIAGETIPAPDATLQRTLAEAHVWAKDLRAGVSLTQISRKTGHSEPYIRTRIPLAFLAPRIQAAILDGKQPAELSVAQLVRDGIPMDWTEQAGLLAVGLFGTDVNSEHC